MWWANLIALLLAVGAFTLTKVFYNAYMHPLRHYKGPKLWAATRLPWCWNQYRGRLNHRLVELHKQYGPAVRVAPDEISYNTETAWKTIYSQRSVEMKKDAIFSLVTPTGVPNILTADRLTHSRHRRLLSHAFSEKALREQEDILAKYSTGLLNQLEAKCAEGAIDLAKWFPLTTFDLIGSLSFGQDFSCVETGQPHAFVASIKHVSRELIMSQMAQYYGVGWFRKLFFLRGRGDSRLKNAYRAKEMVDARITRGLTGNQKDFWYYILASDGNKDKGKGLTKEEMVVNAFSIAIAGSDGTAAALTAAVYLLLTHGDIHQRLSSEIRERFDREDDITSANVEGNNIPLLDAVFNETMRLYPPVAITLPRVVPEQGATIDGAFVPEGTIVGVNHLSTYHSEQNFARADEFLPERWLGEHAALNSDRPDVKGSFQPFSVGPRSCLGKNLAKAEMRMILARLLWRFDVELDEKSRDWIKGQKIYGFWVKPPLLCKLQPRAR